MEKADILPQGRLEGGLLLLYIRNAVIITASFQRGKPMLESKKPTATNLSSLDKLKDTDIDYSDIPELDEEFFKQMKLVEPSNKQSLTIRYDAEVVDYFKNIVGKGYQSKMNAILKAYVKTQLKHSNTHNNRG